MSAASALLPLSAAICCAVLLCGSAASRRDRPWQATTRAADWSRSQASSESSTLLSCFEPAGPCGLGRRCHSGGGWTAWWRFFCFIAVCAKPLVCASRARGTAVAYCHRIIILYRLFDPRPRLVMQLSSTDVKSPLPSPPARPPTMHCADTCAVGGHSHLERLVRRWWAWLGTADVWLQGDVCLGYRLR